MWYRCLRRPRLFVFFFLDDAATPDIYTLSLHDALPISALDAADEIGLAVIAISLTIIAIFAPASFMSRSEEHTSELQSRLHLVCRLLLEKKNIRYIISSLGRLTRTDL